MLPFTPEVFFALFEDYNQISWPNQVLAILFGLLIVRLIFRTSNAGSRVIGVILAGWWLWIGVVYHWMYFAQINFAAPVFAGLFILQGLLVAWRLVFRSDVSFAYAKDNAVWAGLFLMVFAMALYPLLGMLAGHVWPQNALFGVAPSPTTIFTFGLLLVAQPRVPMVLLIIPVLWAVIGSAAIFLLDMPENISLPLAAAVGLALAIAKNRRAT